MKKNIVMLSLTLAAVMGLAGCSAKNTPAGSQSPSASVSPYVTPYVTPSTSPHVDVLPDDTLPNDAYEGGGAGGTNDHDGVYDNDGIMDNGTVNNGNGAVNNGNGAIGDVVDGENSRVRTTAYQVAIWG